MGTDELTPWELSLFGGWALQHGPTEVSLPRRCQELIAALALRGALSREQTAALLARRPRRPWVGQLAHRPVGGPPTGPGLLHGQRSHFGLVS